jgi:Ser/Thr protein kinase RdoA (MazF antagonist)
VKVLPTRPHIDHLRRQAHEHLRDLRRSHPATTLSDAQASLADQYGFPSWTALKSEVEHRAWTAVEVLDPATASAVTARFGLGAPVGEVPLVERGPSGASYRITGDAGRWLLREVAHPADPAPELELTAAARAAGVPLPQPVADGRPAEVAGRTWRCFEWLDTGPAVSRPVDPTTASAMGALLARLHAPALPAPGPVLPWLTRRPHPSDWARLAPPPGDSPLFDTVRPTLAELSAPAEPPTEPLILCHRDLTPANVRRLNGTGLAVVGWERTGPLPARWELGYVLLQWTTGTDDRADAATAAAILEGYRAAGGMPEPVDRTLFTAAVTAWLNWTFAQLVAARQDPADVRTAAEVEHLLRTPPTPRRLDVLLAG